MNVLLTINLRLVDGEAHVVAEQDKPGSERVPGNSGVFLGGGCCRGHGNGA